MTVQSEASLQKRNVSFHIVHTLRSKVSLYVCVVRNYFGIIIRFNQMLANIPHFDRSIMMNESIAIYLCCMLDCGIWVLVLVYICALMFSSQHTTSIQVLNEIR